MRKDNHRSERTISETKTFKRITKPKETDLQTHDYLYKKVVDRTKTKAWFKIKARCSVYNVDRSEEEKQRQGTYIE